MEKISGILPASPRTRVVDTSTAQPARPGAPAFGRPMGKNSLGDRITLSKQLEEMREVGQPPAFTPESPVYKNPTEAKKLKVIEELNKKFFTNPMSEVRENDMTKSEEVLGKAKQNESLFFVEKELQPVSSPIKETSENKIA